MKKRFVSMLLALAMCMGLAVPAFAAEPKEENSGEYFAQMYHAVGVNEYGSNIYDVSEITSNLPVFISQKNSGELTATFSVDGKNVIVNGSVRGSNMLGNMLYYDSAVNTDEFSVMVMSYIDSFSPGIVVAQDYVEHNPSANKVLQIYLKSSNSDIREYYFVEIFDFDLNCFSDIDAVECEPDYWMVNEFQPVNSTVQEVDGPATYATIHTKYLSFTDTYTVTSYTVDATIRLKLTADITDVPRNQFAEWIYRCEVESKTTKCAAAPELNSNSTSGLAIYEPTLIINAPRNCAFSSATIDGEVRKIGSKTISASLSVCLGPLSVNYGLGAALSSLGKVDLNDTFDSFDNSNVNSAVRVLKTDFSGGGNFKLYDIGNYVSVTVHVRDYGKAATSMQPLSAKWTAYCDNDFDPGPNQQDSMTTDYYVSVK